MRGLGSVIVMVHINDNPYRLERRGHSTHPAEVLNLTCSFTGSARHQIMSLKRQASPPPDGHPFNQDDLTCRDVV